MLGLHVCFWVEYTNYIYMHVQVIRPQHHVLLTVLSVRIHYIWFQIPYTCKYMYNDPLHVIYVYGRLFSFRTPFFLTVIWGDNMQVEILLILPPRPFNELKSFVKAGQDKHTCKSTYRNQAYVKFLQYYITGELSIFCL